MKFTNAAEFNYVMRKYASKKGLELRSVKDCLSRVRVRCKDNCLFVLYGNFNQSRTFQIKRFNNKHKCTKTIKNKLASSKFLYVYFKDRIRSQPIITLKQIQKHYRKELNACMTISKCAKAKKKVMDKVNKCYKSKYGLLYRCAKESKLSNSSTITNVRVDDSNLDGILYFSKFYKTYNVH